jgi:hypothetical protein
MPRTLRNPSSELHSDCVGLLGHKERTSCHRATCIGKPDEGFSSSYGHQNGRARCSFLKREPRTGSAFTAAHHATSPQSATHAARSLTARFRVCRRTLADARGSVPSHDREGVAATIRIKICGQRPGSILAVHSVRGRFANSATTLFGPHKPSSWTESDTFDRLPHSSPALIRDRPARHPEARQFAPRVSREPPYRAAGGRRSRGPPYRYPPE